MNRFCALALTIVTLGLGACAAPEITVDNAWIRTPAPGRNVTAGYFDLTNDTAESITLIAADSDTFASVTIHESRVIDGIWEMSPLSSLTIDPGAQVSLHPGGIHLMMTGARHSVSTGELTTIQLQFDDGKLVTFPAVVHDSAP